MSASRRFWSLVGAAGASLIALILGAHVVVAALVGIMTLIVIEEA